MEILVPGPEADARVTELRAAGFDLVDGWSAGGPELTALAALVLLPVAHHQRVLIVDFGSQVTQLIARRVREAGFEIGNVAVQLVGERPRVAARSAEASRALSEVRPGQ